MCDWCKFGWNQHTAFGRSIDINGQTALFGGSIITELLIRHGVDPKVIDIKGRTALFGCSYHGVKFLIKHGVDPNVIDNNGQNALFYCDKICNKNSKYNKFEKARTAEMLIRNGVDPQIIDHNGRTPLFGCQDISLAQILLAPFQINFYPYK